MNATLRAPVRILLLVLAAIPAACSSPTDQAGDDLHDNRDRWEALALHSYSFQFRRLCFCGGPIQPLRVVVKDDAVVSVTDAATGQPPQFLSPGWTGTIDEIFDELIHDAERPVASMELSFDPTYHFPTSARVDRIANAIDDEYQLELSDLQPAR